MASKQRKLEQNEVHFLRAQERFDFKRSDKKEMEETNLDSGRVDGDHGDVLDDFAFEVFLGTFCRERTQRLIHR